MQPDLCTIISTHFPHTGIYSMVHGSYKLKRNIVYTWASSIKAAAKSTRIISLKMILRLWASARSSANYAFVPLPQFTDILYGLILCCQSKYFYCSLKKILFGVVSRRSNCKANPMCSQGQVPSITAFMYLGCFSFA